MVLLAEADLEDALGIEIKYLERFLHENYSNKRFMGEWFSLTPKEIVDIYFFLHIGRDLGAEFFGIGEEREEYKRRIKEIEGYAT